MKRLKKYLLLLFIAFVLNVGTTNALDYSLNPDDENHISIGDYVIGTHLYTTDFTSSAANFSDKAILYGASSIEASTINDIEMLFCLGDSMYETLTDTIKEYDEDSTIFITHVNGVCVDPSCDGTTYVTVSFKSTNPDDIFADDTKIRVKYGDRISASDLPKFLNRPGYKFAGWSLEDDEDGEFDFSTPITEDITLETNWEAIEYEITYVDGSDSNTAPKCYYDVEGKKCSFADLGAKANYTFVGWTTTAPTERGIKVVYHVGDDMAAVLGNVSEVTLYAVWEPIKYTVKFDLNGGTLNGQEVVNYSYNIESTILALPVNITRVGYEFVGWEYNGNLYPNEYADGVVANGMTFTAKWTPIHYSFQYKNNPPIVCEYDNECTINAVAEEVEGKTFSRWYVKIADSKIYLNGTVKNFTADNNLYKLEPEYTSNYYAITYDYAGGKAKENNVDTYVYEEGKTIDLVPPIKDGYTFTGWKVDSEVAEITNNKLKIKKATDFTVGAEFRENTYTLRYYKDTETTEYNDVTCQYSKCKTNPALTDEENDFDGWVTANGLVFGVEKSLVAIDTFANNDNVVELKALWTNKYRYSVSYDLKGGLLDSESAIGQSSYLPGKTVILPNPIKEGYTFAGWSLNGFDIDERTELTGYEEDLRLVARWTPISYTVEYYGIDGSVIGTDNCTYDTPCELTKHSDIARLVGWSKTAINGELYYGDGLNVLNLPYDSEHKVKLYGVYTDVGYYNVEFALGVGETKDGLDLSGVYKENDVITLPELEVKTDDVYEFVGWYVGEEEITESTVTVAANMTIEARWRKLNSYEISFTEDENVLATGKVYTRDQVVLINEDGSKTLSENYNRVEKIENFEITIDDKDMSNVYETTDYKYYIIELYNDDELLEIVNMKTADILLSSNESDIVLNSNYSLNKNDENFRVVVKECNEDFEEITDGLVFEI